MKAGVEYVILGALSLRPMTGYEIKQLVDHSTRFFWAASYGQIYPELHRLEQAGLVAGEPDPQGGRKRNRYSLTAEGRARLHEWLRAPGSGYELRDEGLLKLFFARDFDTEGRLEVVRAMRADREAVLEQLREIERRGVARETGKLVLELGLGHQACQVELLRRLEAQLSETAEVPS